MKIGVLSDIHGNHLALEAVLKEARKLGVEKLLILGDLVGYYYHSVEVLQQLEEWSTEMIRGNHEEMMKIAQKDYVFSESVHYNYGSSINIALETLSIESINLLTSLPSQKEINLDGSNILMCHGSPWDYNFYIYPDSSTSILEKCNLVNKDFIFIGHSHYPFVSIQGSTMLANVGSVGQSRDKGGLASWVVFDTVSKTIVFKHTKYDVEPLVQEVLKIDPHVPYLHKVLVRN